MAGPQPLGKGAFEFLDLTGLSRDGREGWVLRRCDMLGVNDGGVQVACEVVSIEGQEMGDTVDLHRGDQPCIVHLRARNPMTEQELSPLVIRGHAIRQESKIPLDDAGPPFGFRGWEAEAAACRRRARADTPELRQDLRREAEHLSAPPEGSKGFDGKGMRWVRFVRQAQEDICVEEVGHLSVVSVDVSAGEICRQGREMFRAFGEVFHEGLKLRL
jgi:hypothetical protein